jgi:hypothetical protein
MDLQTLQSAIRNAGQRTPFSLDASVLGEPPTAIYTLLGTLFQKVQLDLSNAHVDAGSATPSASGTLASPLQTAYGFLSGFQVTAVFSVDAQQAVQLKMTLQPPPGKIDNWGLPDALTGWDKSLAGAFRWSKTTFSFNTASPAQLPSAFPTGYGFPATSVSISNRLQTGMALQADLEYIGQETEIEWLLGGKKVQVQGPIAWDGPQPAMDLASGPLTSLSLEKFTLPVKFHFISMLLEVPAEANNPAAVVVTPLGVIEGDLGLPAGAPNITIPFYLQFYSDPPGQVRAVGNFRQASAYGLTELGNLLGVGSLSSQQSAQFPVLDGLALETIVLTVLPSKKELLSAAATVSYTPPGGAWKPFGNLLTFEGLFVTFAAYGPFAKPSLETVVDCRAGLAGGKLDAWIALPNLSFGCELQDGDKNPIDLTQILDGITGGAFTKATPGFKLLCPKLRVLGNASQNQNLYRFQATVQDNWTFDILGAKFALSSIGFDLTHQAGTTTGQVVAQFLVANVGVQISADYQGAQQGWSFSGGTLGPQNIPLTDLIGDALKLFNLSLPANAPQIKITDLQMMLQTGSMDFGFSCEGQVSMLGTTMEIDIDLGRTHDDPSKPSAVTTTFTGYLSIGPSTFEVDFTAAPTGASVLFKWTDKDQPLTFEDIAKWAGYDKMPPLPEGLDLSLSEAEFYYDFTKHNMVFSATSGHGSILFASFMPEPPSVNTQRIYQFELDLALNLDLTDLPLIGEHLPAPPTLGVKDLQVIISSANLAADADMKTLTTLVAAVGQKPLLPTALNSGLTFATEFQVGSGRQTFVLPLTSTGSTGTPPQAPTPAAGGAGLVAVNAAAAAPVPPRPNYKSDAKWLTVGKSFGPVSFQRIGVLYQDSKLFFLIDASLNFSALVLAADGLGVGSPLTGFHPVPHLDGLSLSFSSEPVTIDGGFLVVPPPLSKGVTEEYMGEVVIAIKPYLISGVAAYAKVDGDASLFVFAQVQGEFGGPPAFFVTGFMGGFGYNSQLTLPAPDQVYSFPFVAGLDNPKIFGSAKPTPIDVLNVLSGNGSQTAWVTPMTGENWIAAGVMFRSFELVLGRVLLVVAFGKDFEIALLGLASMSLPQGAAADAYAYVELQLEAVFKPSEGSFFVIASLTQNSFLLTKDCHLTGGFAFCLWFGSNVHSGDFVVTVGGYHPAFVAPLWYPKVALVGFNWAVGGGVTIKGGAYFALTPTAAMAGGGLEVLYQSGDLRAWFTAYANLMIRWKPFYFTAGIGISLGASFRLNLLFTSVTMTIEIGASLELWGPPTGGVVRVHLFIISFSVSFGADPSDPAELTLDWKGFQSLLPNSPATQAGGAPSGLARDAVAAVAPAPAQPSSTAVLLSVNLNGGLLRQDSSGNWVVRGDELVFTTQSAIPASSLQISGKALPLPVGAPSTINIRPMKQVGVSSVHAVTLIYIDENKDIDLSTWSTLKTETANLPEALWGVPLSDDSTPAPAAATIAGLPTGIRFTPPRASAGAAVGPLDPSSLIDPLGGGYMPLNPSAQPDAIPAPVVDANSITEIMTTLASPAMLKVQQALVAALTGFGAAPPTSAPLTQLAKQAGSLFSEAPLRAA